MKMLPAREAKNQFGAAIDAAQREAVIITKHGRPIAGLVSIQELAQIPRYQKLNDSWETDTPEERMKKIMRWYGAFKGTFGSGEEIDRYIREERDSWEK